MKDGIHHLLQTGPRFTDTLLFLRENRTCTMPMNHHENCLKVLNDSSSAPVQLWRWVMFKIDDVIDDVMLKKSSSSRSSTNSLPFSKLKGHSVLVVKSIFIWLFCGAEKNTNVVKTHQKGCTCMLMALNGQVHFTAQVTWSKSRCNNKKGALKAQLYYCLLC